MLFCCKSGRIYTLFSTLPEAIIAPGLDQLRNASRIGAVMDSTNYGNINFISDKSTWRHNAKQSNEEGIAYREALIKLRPFDAWWSLR